MDGEGTGEGKRRGWFWRKLTYLPCPTLWNLLHLAGTDGDFSWGTGLHSMMMQGLGMLCVIVTLAAFTSVLVVIRSLLEYELRVPI